MQLKGSGIPIALAFVVVNDSYFLTTFPNKPLTTGFPFSNKSVGKIRALKYASESTKPTYSD